jgi:peptidoglycan/LPS O-acetylase OafA/YrhL
MTAADRAQRPVDATGTTSAGVHFGGFESLRALAASMVVVHHAASLAGPARAGRLATPASVLDGGVAVFFVLSGFLIYRPFVAAHLAGRTSPRWRSFWWRRVLRIVPAYWLALTFFWSIGSFHLGPQWWRYYLFLQVYDRYTVLGGIVQAWSLCTEMTFYLLVPVWAALVARLAGRAAGRLDERSRAVAQLAGCAALWTAGVASRAAFDRWAPGRRGLAFNWLPTNLDLFATGMAVAVVSVWAAHHPATRSRLDRLATPVWPWWGAAVALLAWYAYAVGPADFATGYAGWFWQRRQLVLALFTVLLLVPAVFGDQRAGLVRRWWSWRPIVWVGAVSYGLYLWHLDWMQQVLDGPGRWGWLSATAGDVPMAWMLAVGFGLGLASAAVSWYLLERPLQAWKGLFDPRPASVGSLGATRSER